MKKYLPLLLFFLVGVMLLTLCMPREGKLAFDYREGTPWKYAPLIADFDFPINKSASQVQAERDSVLAEFMPFFALHREVGSAQLDSFRRTVREGGLKGVPAACIEYVARNLADIYAKGLMEPQQMAALHESKTCGVRIVEGQEAWPRTLGEVFTTRSAYDHIAGGDTLRFPRELLAQCHISNYLTPNLQPDTAKTKSAREAALASVVTSSGMVVAGQRIVDMGEMVTPEISQMLDSFAQERSRSGLDKGTDWSQVAGQALYVLLILSLFPIYLLLFRRDYLETNRTLALFFSLIVAFPLIGYMMVRQHLLSVYLVPFAAVPLFVRIFFDSRTATMALLASTLLTAASLTGPFEFFVVEIFMGLTAIYALKELTERSQILRTALLVTLVGLLFQLAYDTAHGTALSALDRSRYVYIASSGVALLFAYPLMYLLERLFGFTSSVTLVELSNINHPLLRRMSKVAQGTFNHSMQVANLAAEVANKIGAQTQLARTGALFHDIGKMDNAAFFTENQSGGVNPHDTLEADNGMDKEERSSQIIIDHVRHGLRLAEQYYLPKAIRDFIATHHGRGKTGYFYIQWQNNHPGETPRDELFSYPGPDPFTREQAVLMMCDSVEAASRSLKEYNEESITALVGKIIDGQVKAGFFKNCPITFRDIEDAKQVLCESLKTIYHTRIAYPELNRNERPTPHKTSLFGSGFMGKLKN